MDNNAVSKINASRLPDHMKNKMTELINAGQLPEIVQSAGFLQNTPEHNHNLLIDHMLASVEQADKLCQTAGVSEQDRETLLLAMSLHDIGKTTKNGIKMVNKLDEHGNPIKDEKGKLVKVEAEYEQGVKHRTFFGHAEESAKSVPGICEKMGCDEQTTALVTSLVKLHDEHMNIDGANGKTINNYIKKLQDNFGNVEQGFELLSIVGQADILSQNNPHEKKLPEFTEKTEVIRTAMIDRGLITEKGKDICRESVIDQTEDLVPLLGENGRKNLSPEKKGFEGHNDR